MTRRVKRNVDFTISGADRRRVAQSQVEIHRQSNVLDYQVNLTLGDNAPDYLFNLVEHLLRLFDACTNRGTNVETELAGVHIREKIFAEKWRHENERENHYRHHHSDHQAGMVKRPLQARGVKAPQLL